MKFDEAIEHFRNNTDISGTAVFLNDVEDTLKELRQEYAPTVEMTKDKFKEVNSTVHEVGEEFEQDELPDDIRTTDKMIELESGFVLLKDLNVILHPETIKIVDE